MLKFVSAYLALSYLAFATIGVAGILQTLAAWHPFVGLALLDYRQPSFWKRAVGPGLIVAAYAWFFGTRHEILTPGPAGAELTVLFGGGVILALAATLFAANLLHPYQRATKEPGLPTAGEPQPVQLDPGRSGLLYLDGTADGRRPAVCLIPDPSTSASQLRGLVAALTGRGLAVLVPQWDASTQRYPDALALIPLALGYLSRQPCVDAKRLAVVGAGLGGDLALRAAAADRNLSAVASLGPLLAEANAVPGLGLLREMTYVRAATWGLHGRRRALLRDLDTVGALAHGPRAPVLVLYGSGDALVSPARAQERLARADIPVRTTPGEGHTSLLSSEEAQTTVAQWLAEKLDES